MNLGTKTMQTGSGGAFHLQFSGRWNYKRTITNH
jgi:hypothetical protein